MGLIKQGILDGVSGKVGNVIGSSWRGRDFVRIKPAIVHDANSKKQQDQRTRFAGIVHFAQIIKYPIIKPIWNGASGNITGHNLFVKTNMSAFDEHGDIKDYSKLKLSTGDIYLPADFKIAMNSETKSLDISWKEDMLMFPQVADECLNLIIFNKNDEKHRPRAFYNLEPRTKTSQSVLIDMYDEGSVLEIYAFFAHSEFTVFSESIHKEVEVSLT